MGKNTRSLYLGEIMYEYRATVDRVIDGDTVDVIIDLGFNIRIKERIRLFGIDTPEIRTRDLEEKNKGLEAKARLEELILDRNLIIQSSEFNSTGKYGRTLGIIFVTNVDGRQNINEVLLEEGHAEIYR